jgi:broad specificity phosphatase PhoE
MGVPLKSIVLIRHAEAEHLVRDLIGGWTDTELTDLGCRQAEALALRLKSELGETPLRLYCSDLKRATQTAEIIGQELGLDHQPTPELRELNNGIAAGMTTEEAKIHFTEPTEPLLEWRPYPGSENWREFYLRVSGFMENLVESDLPILIVAHGGTVMQIISWWLGLDMDTISRVSFRISPASVSVLDVTELKERRIERLNDTSHLCRMGLSERIRLNF